MAKKERNKTKPERELIKELEFLQRHLKELEKFDDQKSILASNLSHEFKNYLAVIKESFEVVIDGLAGELNQKQKEILGTGKSKIKDLMRVNSAFLDLLKHRRDRLELDSVNR